MALESNEYDEANPLSGLLGAILGKEVDQDTASSQVTAGTTQQNATQNTAVTGSQSASSATQSNNTQASSGTTQNTGTTSTTGTIGKTNNTTATGTQTEQSTADIAGLQSVFAQQQAGITPEMLAAIFQQGAKAAPQLVTANAQALGARAQNNTPVAAVLQNLQMDLTAKAADLNRQMLSDAGATAGKIGELTRSTSKTSSEASSSVGQDVQNLLTATDSTQIAKNIIDTINNTAMQQVQQNAQNTAGTTSQTGSQTQQSSANESKNTATTINTGAAKAMAGLFAGGVALDQLFRQATGQGFMGTITQFAKQLAGQGATISDLNSQLEAAGSPPLDPLEVNDVLEVPDMGDLFGLTNLPNVEYTPDYYEDFGWADGGVMPDANFLPVPNLLKKKQQIGNPDADLDKLLSSLDGSGNTTGTSSSAGASAAADATSLGEMSGSGSGSISAGTGQTGTLSGFASTASKGIGIAGRVAGAVAGNPLSIATLALDMLGFLNKGNTATGMLSADMALSPSAIDPTALESMSLAPDNVQSMAELGVSGYGDSSSGIGGGPGGADGQAGDAGSSDAGSSGAGGDTGSDSGQGGDGTGSGGDTGDGGGWADGGVMKPDTEHDEMMAALGITRGANGLTFNAHALKMMHHAITRKAATPAGKADGGVIKGPGTGISDSVPAVAPGGRPIAVAAGEVIVPADVVQKFGEEAFLKLIDMHHTPAATQRANGGR